MKNSIEAFVEFSFRGEYHTPKVVLDLDKIMEQHGELPEGFHTLIAELSGIDTYSYLFDVMLADEVQFANPTGIAEQCLTEGGFDAELFMAHWKEQKRLELLKGVASEYLKINDLDQHGDVKEALIAAYQLGWDARVKRERQKF